MDGIMRILDQRGTCFWWTVRFVLVALIAFAVFVLGWIGGVDYVTNIYTELIGVVTSIGFTVVIVDRFYERRNMDLRREEAQRDKERQTEELKRELVWRAKSRSNEAAIKAVEDLRYHDWLTGPGGLLKEAFLNNANLRNVNLRNANLQQAYLWRAELNCARLAEADLQEADLSFANLQGANLTDANLREADLTNADLQNANLRQANLNSADLSRASLQDANLDRASLENAYLHNVNLENANLRGAFMEGATVSLSEGPVASRWGAPGTPGSWTISPPTLLRGATLPDGVPFPEDPSLIDELEKYTNPDHPEFHETLEKIKDIHRAWEAVA